MSVHNKNARTTSTAAIISCATKPKALATMLNAAEISCARRSKAARMVAVFAKIMIAWSKNAELTITAATRLKLEISRAICYFQGFCENNNCVFVDCKTDEHCLDDAKKDCRDGKCRCRDLTCEPVTCMGSLHCKPDEICSGNNPADKDVEANSCYVPECKSIAECQEQEICKSNKCEPVECTSSSHCADRKTPHVCRKNECEPVECAFHDDCEDQGCKITRPDTRFFEKSLVELGWTHLSHLTKTHLWNPYFPLFPIFWKTHLYISHLFF